MLTTDQSAELAQGFVVYPDVVARLDPCHVTASMKEKLIDCDVQFSVSPHNLAMGPHEQNRIIHTPVILGVPLINAYNDVAAGLLSSGTYLLGFRTRHHRRIKQVLFPQVEKFSGLGHGL